MWDGRMKKRQVDRDAEMRRALFAQVIGEANFKTDSKMKVSLANPNIAVATDPKTGKHHKGTWTNVYDEGFEVSPPLWRQSGLLSLFLRSRGPQRLAGVQLSYYSALSGERRQQKVLRF